MVVDDVQKDPRYLSGSTMVKSEIVVPIIVNKLVAELDIESYFPSTFNQSEQQFVEACAAVVGRYLAGSKTLRAIVKESAVRSKPLISYLLQK